jgi:hypothetical protein
VPRRGPARASATRWTAAAAPLLLIALLLGPAAPGAVAAAGVTMDARVMLNGHARVGSWMAIQVDLANDGPPVAGELRIAGGAQGRTRFGLPVDLPTSSRKAVTLYAQPPAFGQAIDVTLVGPAGTVATRKVAFSAPDPSQTVVGVIADKPETVVSALRLPANVNGLPPSIVPLRVGDLPDREDAWDPIDRLVWQDTDTTTLRPTQLAALRGWLAGGGRLTIVGGTAGADVLAGDPASLVSLVGTAKGRPAVVPALAGDPAQARGKVLATSGDRIVAGEMRYGNGTVTLVGFDPTGRWLAGTPASDALWSRLVPLRVGSGPLVIGDDSQLVGALQMVPSLALPPVGGLLGLLVGYILLVGPVNYMVLRRLDKREWAWVTMPALVVGFTAAAFIYGNTLRGGQVLINELAIVRGAPGTTDAVAQVYVGLFSPTRSTYQVTVPGGALLSAPYSSDMFGGFDASVSASSLDILQGETTARVRDLSVGYNAMRAVRADVPVPGPRLEADLRLEGGNIMGTIRNTSTTTLERPAILLGGTAAVLPDLAPGASATVNTPVAGNQFGQAISDRILGPSFFGGDPGLLGDDGQRLQVRQAILNQLTTDPMSGQPTNLGADGPVLLAFGRGPIVDVTIDGQAPKATGNILYIVPVDLAVQGHVTFTGDLMRPTTVASNTATFSKGDPFTMNFNTGTVTQAYRPAAFGGTFEPTALSIRMGGGGLMVPPSELLTPTGSGDVEPTAKETAAEVDSLPIVEMFDRIDGQWMRFRHLSAGEAVKIADPIRWVDPATGTVLVRFRSDRQDGVGFQFQVQLEGNAQ